MVYTAGQTPIDPATGKLIEGTIEEQTHRVLQNIKSVLEAADSSLAKVVKTTVFLTSMSDFAAMNGIYAQYFNTDAPPARSTIQVAGLPLGAMIEIETVAILD
jgi:2-iminobutanoate/2-iminopropanoate deaminase